MVSLQSSANALTFENVNSDGPAQGLNGEMMRWILGRQPLVCEFCEFFCQRNLVGIYSKSNDNCLLVFRQVEGSGLFVRSWRTILEKYIEVLFLTTWLSLSLLHSRNLLAPLNVSFRNPCCLVQRSALWSLTCCFAKATRTKQRRRLGITDVVALHAVAGTNENSVEFLFHPWRGTVYSCNSALGVFTPPSSHNQTFVVPNLNITTRQSKKMWVSTVRFVPRLWTGSPFHAVSLHPFPLVFLFAMTDVKGHQQGPFARAWG